MFSLTAQTQRGPENYFSRGPITTSFRLKHPAIFRQLEDRGGDWSLEVA